jgi:hypothetical protein
MENLTLLYSILDKNNKEISKLWITGCPNKQLIDNLNNTGDEGYKFAEILSTLYPEINTYEYLTSFQHGPDLCTFNVCVFTWNIIYDL